MCEDYFSHIVGLSGVFGNFVFLAEMLQYADQFFCGVNKQLSYHNGFSLAALDIA